MESHPQNRPSRFVVSTSVGGSDADQRLQPPEGGRSSKEPPKGGTTNIWIVFAVALALRLIYLYEISDNPTFFAPVVDSQVYDSVARAFAEGRGMHYQFFWQAFFYPFFLSIVYTLSHGSILCAKVLQTVLGACTCALICLLGRRVLSPRAGIVAGLLAAAYGPLIFFESELLATGWAAFWSVALVLLFLKTRETGKTWLFAALGAAGALAILTRPTFLPFFAVGCAWLAAAMWREKKDTRRLAGGGLAALIGFALVAVPVAEQCRRVTGRFTIVPSSGGVNFYIGNNPRRDETLQVRPGAGWERLLSFPAGEGITGDWEQSRYFYRKTREYIQTMPLDYAKGLCVKAWQFVNSREIPRNVDPYLFRRWSAVLRALLWRIDGFGFPFGVLLPLALLGLLRFRRRMPTILILYLAMTALSIVLVFVAARYRVEAIPVLCVPAAGGLAALGEWAGKRDWRTLLTAATGLAAMAALFSLPPRFAVEKANPGFEVEMVRYSAMALAQKGQPERAMEQLRRAVAIAPKDARTIYRIGFLLDQKGDRREAEARYREAVALEPDLFEAQFKLGNILLADTRTADAIACFREALRANPGMVAARCNLAQALTTLGRAEEAIAEYRETLKQSPDLAQAHGGLGRALEAAGRLDEAIEHYRKAVELAPDLAIARSDLERACRRKPGANANPSR